MNFREGTRRLGILLGISGGILGGCLAYGDARVVWDSHTAYRRFESLMAAPTMRKVAKAARDYRTKPRLTVQPDTAKPGRDWFSRNAPTLSDADVDKYDALAKKYGGRPMPPVGHIEDGYRFKGGDPRDKANWEAVPQGTTHKYRIATDKGTYEVETKEPDTHSDSFTPDATSGGNAVKSTPNDLVNVNPKDLEISESEFEDGSRELFKASPLLNGNHDGINSVHIDARGVVSSIELSTGESVQRTEAPRVKAYLAVLLYPILGFLLPWGGIRILTWVGSGFFERPS